MTEELSCTQADCTLNSDGLCQRGIDPVSDCPSIKMVSDAEAVDLERDEVAPDTAVSGEPVTQPSTARVPIYSGEALTVSEATKFLRDRKSSVVVLAGDVDTGKTTLLAELYQLFLKGAVAGLSFAGSHTLMGFERRCFFARLVSGVAAPDTERTRHSDEMFLHLLFRDGQSNFEQVLFSDITGEVFERLRISAEEAASLSHIARVDHLAILVPCDRLVDSQRRQKTRDDAIDVIRRLLEAELIGPNTNLQVVFSKWDFVTASDDKAAHEAFVTSCQEKIESAFSGAVGGILFVRLDARSQDPYRLIELLEAWRRPHAAEQVSAPEEGLEHARFFCKVSQESVLEGLP